MKKEKHCCLLAGREGFMGNLCWSPLWDTILINDHWIRLEHSGTDNCQLHRRPVSRQESQLQNVIVDMRNRLSCIFRDGSTAGHTATSAHSPTALPTCKALQNNLSFPLFAWAPVDGCLKTDPCKVMMPRGLKKFPDGKDFLGMNNPNSSC